MIELNNFNNNVQFKNENGILYQGDCLELMDDIPDKTIDMILCDLPYGITNCSWDSIIPLDKLWEQYQRIIKDNGAIVLFGSQPFTSKLIMSNLKRFKYEWIWEKERGTGFQFAKNQPLRKVENICIFYKRKCIYNPIMTPLDKPYKHALPINKSDTLNKGFSSIDNGDIHNRIYKEYTHSYPNNILKFARDNAGKGLHPTQKPVALCEYLIKTYTNENDIILDNCSGSCTTAIAAINTNRKWLCIEKEQKYCDVSVKRLHDCFNTIHNN
jgi:site-specific DNA-methyltransferase (adenine-specific)